MDWNHPSLLSRGEFTDVTRTTTLTSTGLGIVEVGDVEALAPASGGPDLLGTDGGISERHLVDVGNHDHVQDLISTIVKTHEPASSS
jgi:hypothetical protein